MSKMQFGASLWHLLSVAWPGLVPHRRLDIGQHCGTGNLLVIVGSQDSQDGKVNVSGKSCIGQREVRMKGQRIRLAA